MPDISVFMPYVTAFGIISGFLLASYTAWRNERTRKVTNYLTLVASHRAIWTMPFQYPELENVLSREEGNETRPYSEREEMFVSFIILNLSANFEMMRTTSIVSQEGLRADIKAFFSLPLPRRIWEETKRFQNDRFVEFVDHALRNG